MQFIARPLLLHSKSNLQLLFKFFFNVSCDIYELNGKRFNYPRGLEANFFLYIGMENYVHNNNRGENLSVKPSSEENKRFSRWNSAIQFFLSLGLV